MERDEKYEVSLRGWTPILINWLDSGESCVVSNSEKLERILCVQEKKQSSVIERKALGNLEQLLWTEHCVSHVMIGSITGPVIEAELSTMKSRSVK